MLVKRACATDGEVKDCSEVLAASNKYRQSQDCLSGFINENIAKDSAERLGKQILNQRFKEWIQNNYGNRKAPKLAELEEAMIKRFGNPDKTTKKWHGIKLIYEDAQENDIDDVNN